MYIHSSFNLVEYLKKTIILFHHGVPYLSCTSVLHTSLCCRSIYTFPKNLFIHLIIIFFFLYFFFSFQICHNFPTKTAITMIRLLIRCERVRIKSDYNKLIAIVQRNEERQHKGQLKE